MKEREPYMHARGFDYVHVGLVAMGVDLHRCCAADTAALPRKNGRSYQDEHTGPIMSWDDFEKFQWPDPNATVTFASAVFDRNE